MAKHLEPRPGLIEKFSKNSRNSIKALILTLLAMTTVTASTIPGASSEVPQVAGTPVKMEERLRQAFLPPLDPQYASEKDMVLSYAELGYNSVSDFISETATNKAEREEAARIAAEKAAAEEAARLAAEEEKKRAEEARIAAEKAAAEALAREAAEDQRRQASTRSAERSDPQGAKAIAAEMVADRGWDSSQFTCLDNLWERESNWNHLAKNPSSGAYGIPQSLPGNKMAAAGSDWQTNPTTQITWGLGYIADRYGSPCEAWQHSEAKGWY